MSDYDVKRGGVQRVHSDGPSLCWIWTKVLRDRVWVVHLSLGPPLWLKPDVRVKRYSGITERRVGWGLVAVQVASKPAGASKPDPGLAVPARVEPSEEVAVAAEVETT